MNNDSVLSKTIDELNELNFLRGNEKLLVQVPEDDETKSITVDLLLANMVNLLANAGTIAITEKDPTVPSYIKDLSQEEVDILLAMNDRVTELEEEVKRLKSSTIKIVKFNVTPMTVEIGTVINSVKLEWDINFRNLTKQSIDDVEIPDLTKRSRVIDGPFTQSKEFTLKVEGDDGNSDIRTTEIKFLNNIYYGTEKIADINSDFINNSLNRVLSSSKVKGFTVISREQEYIYIALPVRFGEPTFEITTEVADFELIEKFQHENSSGYVEEYAVYRTTNVHLGQTTVRMR